MLSRSKVVKRCLFVFFTSQKATDLLEEYGNEGERRGKTGRKLPTGRMRYAPRVSVQMRKEMGTVWISNASLAWIHCAAVSST